MTIHWFKTADQPPPSGTVILGLWPIVAVESVVFDNYHGWLKAPGNIWEPRSEPEYWAEFPNLPDGIERGE